MRIIAGSAGGIQLVAPRGDQTRPTSDRTRAAIFSSLGARVIDARVLDLFAGSGGLGLEAVSRGARSVLFVEQSFPVIRCIERNIVACRRNLPAACDLKIRRGDAFDVLKSLAASQARFDLVLADPPYGPVSQAILNDSHVPLLIQPTGILVLESSRRTELEIPETWRLEREADYGDTRVSVLTLGSR
jgi:16S rRNA (guanine966-N2)-methyltransferase